MTIPARTDGGSILLHSVMLAEYVKVDAAGLVTILGGGPVRYTIASLPGQLSVGVAIQVSTIVDRHIDAPFRVQVNRPDGSGAARVVGQMGLTPRSEYSNVAINVPVLVDVAGRWTVEVTLGEAEPRADLWFNIALDAAQQ
jgi:hypothetical protein